MNNIYGSLPSLLRLSRGLLEGQDGAPSDTSCNPPEQGAVASPRRRGWKGSEGAPAEPPAEPARATAHPWPDSLSLDPITVCEVLTGCDPEPWRRAKHEHPVPDPHDLAILRFDVAEAVAQLEAELRAGAVEPRVRLVRGRPLADWLDLDDVARLLRAGRGRRR